MIVPFLFTIDEYSKEQPTYLWVANKFYDFCIKNNYPIIIQEKFAKNPSYYKKIKHCAMTQESEKKFKYKILEDASFDKISKYIITDSEEQQIVHDYKNVDDAGVKLLKEKNEKFEVIIEQKIKQILNDYNKKIEAVFTWVYYPSLESVLAKYNIKLLNFELSTIRLDKYRDCLGYFKIGNKYENSLSYKQYKEFIKKPPELLLNNLDIINLFISDNSVDCINKTDKAPEYDVGIALGLKNDYFMKAFDGKSYKEILTSISNYIPAKKILVRSHPAMPIDETKYEYTFDHSADVTDWITNCKCIAYSISNIGYEAILFGRNIISTNDTMMTSFNYTSSQKYYDPKHYGILELNFLTFAYYAPYDLMFDVDYIKFRLKENDIFKIYQYNISYIFKKYNINLEKFKKMSLEDRFLTILNTHNLSSNEKTNVLKYALNESYQKEMIEKYKKIIVDKDSYIKNLEDTIAELKTILEMTSNELKSVINSRGWKMLEKLRKLKNKITRKKNLI